MSCNTLQDALSSELILHAHDIGTLKQLLLNGANVNYQSQEGWCLLFELISLGLDQHILSLTDMSLDIHIRDVKGRSALFWAIHHEHTKVVDTLLQLDYDSSQVVIDKLPALHYAVYKNNVDIMKALLAGGVDIESQDSDHNTALSYAYFYQRKEMIIFLKQQGASTPNLDYNT